MWPFSNEEEEDQDSSLTEFNEVANILIEDAPDSTTGLSMLRDAYSSYEFKNKETAQSTFLDYSDKVRKKFEDVRPFTSQELGAYAPVSFEEVEGEGDTEEDKRLDAINKWEKANTEFLDSTDDLVYLQSKKQLVNGIAAQAKAKRRDIVGAQNYEWGITEVAVDTAFRAASGAVGPIADLVGLDGIDDYLQEHTSKDRDDSFFAALAQGAGQVGTALGIGALTGGIGAGLYLGAQGLDSVVDVVETADQNEATFGETVAAGSIEAVSQAAQTVVGAKIFGQAGKAIASGVTKQVGPKLTSILGAGAIEGVTEGAGQVASNVAQNTVSVDDVSLLEGVTTSAGVGFLLGSGARGLEIGLTKPEKADAKNKSDADLSDDADFLASNAQAGPSLEEVIADVEGTPPPPKEPMANHHKGVELKNATPVATTEDGSQYVEQDGKLYFTKEGRARQTADNTFIVDEETGKKLLELTNLQTATPDGSPVVLDTDGNELFVEHPFISDTGDSLGDKGTAGKKASVKAQKYDKTNMTQGAYIVQVDPVTRDSKGQRRPNFYISPTKLSSVDSAGAAKVTDNTFEHARAKKLREQYGPELADKLNLETTQQVTDKDGNVIGEKRIGLMRYFRITAAEAATEGTKFLQENGILGTLAHLQSIPKGTGLETSPGRLAALKDAVGIAALNASMEAEYTGDYTDYDKLSELARDVEALEIKLPEASGRELSFWGKFNKTGVEAGGTYASPAVSAIKSSLSKDADVEIERELGQGSKFKDLSEQRAKAEEAVKSLEAAQKTPGLAQQLSNEVELETLREVKAEVEKTEGAKRASRGKENSPVSNRLKDINERIKQLEQSINQQTASANTNSNTTSNTSNTSTGQPTSGKKGKKSKKAAAQNQNQNQAQNATIVTKQQNDLMRVTLKALFQVDEKLRAARKIRDNKLKVFTPADEQTLRGWYNYYNQLPPGENRHRLGKAIYEMEARYLPPNDSRSGMLFNYWRADALSGVDTFIRNAGGNLFNALFTIGDYGMTGLLNDLTFRVSGSKASVSDTFVFLKGMAQGAKKGAVEAADVIKGNRLGRMKLDTDAGFYESPTVLFDKKNFSSIGKTAWWPFKAINESARRGLAAMDSFVYRTVNEGTARMLAHMEAKQQGLSGNARRTFIEDRLFNTSQHLTNIQTQLNAEEQLLRQAGIPVTPAMRTQAIFERMESLRASKSGYGPASDQGGLRAVFMQEPSGVMGVLHKFIENALKQDELAPTINGTKYRVAQTVLPFTRTIANVTNNLMDMTPLGFWGAAKRGSARSAAEAKLAAGEKLSAKEELALSNALEQRQIAGRALVGSTLLGTMYAIAAAESEKEDPFIRFTGNIPKGKYNEYRDKGIPAYSMTIGKMTIPLQYTPAALLPAIIAPLVDARKNGKDDVDKIMAVTAGVVGAISEMSFLKSAGDIFRYATDVDASTDANSKDSDKSDLRFNNLLKTLAANQLKPYIPSVGFLTNVGRWIDENPQDTFNNFHAKMFAQIPVVNMMLPDRPALNMFGEPVTKRFTDRTAIGSFITWGNNDPVFSWMAKTGYRISALGPIVALTKDKEKATAEFVGQREGYKDILDEDESREVLLKSGPLIKSVLSQLSQNPSFEKYNESNQETINEVVNKIRAQVKMEVLIGRMKKN